MKRIAIDLTNPAWSQVHGDLTVYGTYWLADEDGPRPCLVLLPTDQRRWANLMPCVVLLDQAWIWSEEIGDPRRAAQTAFEFATCLGLDPEPTTVMRIRSLIVDHLPDLVPMPPMPADQRPTEPVLGEVTVKDGDGKVIREDELRA